MKRCLISGPCTGEPEQPPTGGSGSDGNCSCAQVVNSFKCCA